MSSNNTRTVQANGGGVGFTGLLFILFLGLKLTGVIAWPWLWVFAPLWIPAAFAALVLLILFLTVIAFRH